MKSVKLFSVFIQAVECKHRFTYYFNKWTVADMNALPFSGTAQYIHSFYGSNLLITFTGNLPQTIHILQV